MAYRSPPSFPVIVIALGGRVFGQEPSSGRRLWLHEAKETGAGSPVRVLVIGSTVYAAPLDHELRLLDYATGRLLARTKIPHATGGTMMAVDGHIYLAGNGAIDCFGLDGQLLWSDDFDGNNARAVSLAVPGYAVQGDLRS